MRSLVENRIRLTLSDPPGRAGTDEQRRRTYVASVLMFLDLLDAAREVDHLARPLPLFYALSQAGRAVVAAHGDQAHVRGHGITEDTVKEPVTLTKIAPQERGLFGAVADAIGAPRPTSGIELGATWAALPDLADTPHGDKQWRHALFIAPEVRDVVSGLPMNAIVVSATAVAGAEVEEDIVRALTAELPQYPNAEHAQLLIFQGIRNLRHTDRGVGLPIVFQSEPNAQGECRHVDFTACIPEHRFAGEYWLIPSVGNVLLPPLLLWWILLFGLSILARYEPAVWRAALDIETPLAVRLEDLLDEALEAVPHWILWALTGEELRTRRP